jgi:hypothetical protein
MVSPALKVVGLGRPELKPVELALSAEWIYPVYEISSVEAGSSHFYKWEWFTKI